MTSKPKAGVKISNLIKWNNYLDRVSIDGKPLVPFANQLAFLRSPELEILYGGGTRGGKMSPVETQVVTPFGLRKLGDLKVGDKISTPDGSAATVIQIHEHGEKDVYNVTFTDGRSLEVGLEHLWKIKKTRKNQRKSNKNGEGGWFIADTDWIIKHMGNDAGYNIAVPLTEAVKFTKTYKYDMMPISPYVLGALIGDGCLMNDTISLTTADEEMIENFKLEGLEPKYINESERNGTGVVKYQVYYNGEVVEGIKKLGLYGKYSYEKFIPKYYKYASVEDRISLIQGLMDTDGYVDDRGHLSYTTTSEQLAKDVQWVIRSLGGRATITTKVPTYTYEEIKKEGRIAYTVWIQIKDKDRLVRLSRKKERCKDKKYIGGFQDPSLTIEKIEYSRKAVCRCITISHVDGLYLAGDFIVTHNSFSLLMAAAQYVDSSNYNAIIFRKTYQELSKGDGLIPLSMKWFKQFEKEGVHWNSDNMQWEFPSGAILGFGYLASDNDKYKYIGQAYQFIGFDELTQQPEDNYTFLFSRLVRDKSQETSNIPLRMRSTTNPNGPHCVPFGDVLTKDGWKDIKEIKKGEMVYSVDKNRNLKLAEVTSTTEADYIGEMKKYVYRGMYIECTPNHRVCSIDDIKKSNSTITIKPLNECPGQLGILRSCNYESDNELKEFIIPFKYRKNRDDNSDVIMGDDFLEFLGWYFSEGSCIHRDKSLIITQTKENNVTVIKNLLDRMNVKYSYDGKDFKIYYANLYSYFKDLGLCNEKKIPDEYMNLSKRQLKILFDTLVAGDGSIRNGKPVCYATTSKKLSEQVGEIAIKLGYTVLYRERESSVGGTIKGNHKQYIVSFKKTKCGGAVINTGNHVYDVNTSVKKKTNDESYQYNGRVYCITVKDTESFIIRQHGSVWFSGNTAWVYDRFVNKRTKPNIRQKIIDQAQEKIKAGILKPEELNEQYIKYRMPKFIPSLAEDNPYLDMVSYMDSLDKLDPVTRAQLAKGNWEIRAMGNMFNREWFEKVPYAKVPIYDLVKVRYWDMAATRDGDFTASCHLGYDKNQGVFYILDMKLLKMTPREIEREIYLSAIDDGPQTIIYMEREPGSAGIHSIDHYKRKVIPPGWMFREDRVSGDKEARARPLSAACDKNLVKIAWSKKSDLWYDPVMEQLETFPEGEHDDAVDALASAFNVLNKRIYSKNRYIGTVDWIVPTEKPAKDLPYGPKNEMTIDDLLKRNIPKVF
jgi:predicted phage terminase large subunit-like protein